MVWYLYLSETPDSHFEIVCLETFSSAPNSSCDIPFVFLKSISFSLKFIVILLWLVFKYKTSIADRCFFINQPLLAICQPHITTAKFNYTCHKERNIDRLVILFLLTFIRLLRFPDWVAHDRFQSAHIAFSRIAQIDFVMVSCIRNIQFVPIRFHIVVH